MMALTIREIFDEAREKCPSGRALGDESLLRKMNTREAELFRTVHLRKTSTVLDIVADQFLYPIGFSKSKILHVIVNGRRYGYEEIDNSESTPPFIYTYDNFLGLYPTPDRTVSGGIFIHHYKEPRKYTIDTLDSYPEFDKDFHMIHVYGLCKDISETVGKFDEASGYAIQYNTVLEEFLKANPEPELPPMRVE